jgi:hypothetical protein
MRKRVNVPATIVSLWAGDLTRPARFRSERIVQQRLASYIPDEQQRQQ